MEKKFLNNMLSKVVDTGGSILANNFEFKHLVLNHDELEYLENNLNIDLYDFLDDFCYKNSINFVSTKENGTVKFIHVTDKNNIDNILKNGFSNNYNQDRIHDLGPGLYVGNRADNTSLDNLYEYIEDCNCNSFDGSVDYNSEIGVIIGTYTGPFVCCIFGEWHEGYISLLGDLSKNIIIEDGFKCDVSDFKYNLKWA